MGFFYSVVRPLTIMIKKYFLLFLVGLMLPLGLMPYLKEHSSLLSLITVVTFWGLPSWYLHWNLDTRNLSGLPTKRLIELFDEWHYAFRGRTWMNSAHRIKDDVKRLKAYQRIFDIESEILQRSVNGEPISEFFLSRVKEKHNFTQMLIK